MTWKDELKGMRKAFIVRWSVVRGVLTWKHAGKVVGKSLQSGMVCG